MNFNTSQCIIKPLWVLYYRLFGLQAYLEEVENLFSPSPSFAWRLKIYNKVLTVASKYIKSHLNWIYCRFMMVSKYHDWQKIDKIDEDRICTKIHHIVQTRFFVIFLDFYQSWCFKTTINWKWIKFWCDLMYYKASMSTLL